jgi:hypothetical protein
MRASGARARPGPWALVALLAAACGSLPAPALRPVDALTARRLDARSRAQAGAGEAAPAVGEPLAATRVYRSLVAPALGGRCRMWPSDSEYVDRRARRCGPVDTAVHAVARLMLEVAASPQILPATVIDGRLRFVDPPTAGSSCGR